MGKGIDLDSPLKADGTDESGEDSQDNSKMSEAVIGKIDSNWFDFRLIECKNDHRSWVCWESQRCGSSFYECIGEAKDAPPISATAYNSILVISLVPFLILLVAIVVTAFFFCRKFC